MGGVLLPPRHLPKQVAAMAGHLIVWRSHFPLDIVNDLITFEHLQGRTTNSDLEMAATLVQLDAIANNYDVHEQPVHTATDNTPMLFSHKQGSVSAHTTPVYLLRMQALHQRFH
jgi:hypothetical protein